METTRTIEFWIGRKGELSIEDQPLGTFGTIEAAADMAVRFAQDSGSLWRIFYPL